MSADPDPIKLDTYELVLGERLPAAMLHRHPGQLRARGGEAQLDLGGDGGPLPGHHEPVRR